MLLTIAIPNCNYTCYRLVADLQRQLAASGADYEIIVADDGSKDQVSVIANMKINELEHCRYIRRYENVGRAAIRNFLIEESQGDWILFMDSDAQVANDQYIAQMLQAFVDYQDYDIISAGLRHPEQCPAPYCSLRYSYERKADLQRGADIRNQQPFAKFTTFNMAFRRKVFEQCRFDEDFHEYGHEDSLLGYQLEKLGTKLIHIDIPLLHMGIESNEVFLRKTEISILSLKKLNQKIEGQGKLEQMAQKLAHWHLRGLLRFSFKIFEKPLRNNLLGNNPNLTIFSIYKLGLYLK